MCVCVLCMRYNVCVCVYPINELLICLTQIVIDLKNRDSHCFKYKNE
jgi:hypothetical protein